MFGLTGLQARIGEYLIVIALVFGMFFYVYHKGEEASDQRWQVAQAKANTEAQAKYNDIATKLENTKAERIVQTNTITKIIPQIVEHTIYSTVCADQQGVDVINKALAGEAYEQPK